MVMFTGLVETTGTIASLGAGRLSVRAGLELAPGDSVAVNGVCLTATTVADGGFDADVMAGAPPRPPRGALAEGDGVNLELPVRAGDRLGGHVVQGHVDGLGNVESVSEEGFARVVRIGASS